ncbi:holin [Crossiella sp. SN42]|uniref:holin n=1 Tax=Crossiella sp. SN42 TaxID=2944808 RepID=UPI00207C6302|nr:holin [Crossiella sp. SN42]MCO1575040.1 holin [Crossiella sp. SN42]
MTVFLRAALERALKTFAQVLGALLAIDGIGLLDAPWGAALSTAGMAAVLSVLSSVASRPVGEPGTPSLTRE